MSVDIITDTNEFSKRIQNPDDQIIGYIPSNSEFINSNWENLVLNSFKNKDIGLVYSDIIISNIKGMNVQLYESYRPNLFDEKTIIISPVFLRNSQKIASNIYGINYCFSHVFIRAVEKSIFCYHIPEPLLQVTFNTEAELEKLHKEIGILHSL